MRKLLFILCFVTALISGCSQTEVLGGDSSVALSFDTHIGKSSRAVAVSRFKEGDTIGVYMYHTPTSWETDGIGGSAPALMENVSLRLDAGVWMYSPTLFWKRDEKYTFFAYAPYKEHTNISNGILPYSVGADETRQEDLLYSVPSVQTKDKSWDGSSTVPDKVQFVFTHALSQVKFSVATEYDYSSLYTIELTDIKLNNIYRTGNLNLISENSLVEPWSGQSASGSIVYSPASLALGVSLQEVTNASGDVWMLLPQTLPADAEVEFTVHLTKVGTTGTAADGDYTLKAPLTAGSWKHNKIYNYQVTLNMDQILGVRPIVIGEPEIIPWEEESAQEIYPVLKVEVPDAGEAGIGGAITLTKSYVASGSAIEITSMGSGKPWSMSVDRSGHEWLSLTDDAEGNTPAATKTGVGNATIYAYVQASSLNREGMITLSREGAENITIQVKQSSAYPALSATVSEAEPGATAKESLLIKTYAAGSSPIQIGNNNCMHPWTISVEAAAQSWLKVADNASGGGTASQKTGVDNRTVYAYVTTGATTDRSGVITLSRKEAEDIKITVVQTNFACTSPDAEAESSLTSVSLVKSYTAGGSELNIVSNGSSMPWTISVDAAAQGWLKVADNASGSGAASQKTGTGNKTLYAYVTALGAGSADRSGTIMLSREGAKTITIRVTQGDFAYINGVKWARGNLRLDGIRVAQDKPNYGGLFFKRGSLIGVKPFNELNIFDKLPDKESYIGIRPPEYTGTIVSWNEIPLLTTEVPVSYNASAGTGDICKYLSDKGLLGGSGTVWRLPTKTEVEKLISMPQLKYGTFVTADQHPLTEPVPSGYFVGKGAASATDSANPPAETVFLPVGGGIINNGYMTGYNQGSYHWTSTLEEGSVSLIQVNTKVVQLYKVKANDNSTIQSGGSMRCVRNN